MRLASSLAMAVAVATLVFAGCGDGNEAGDTGTGTPVTPNNTGVATQPAVTTQPGAMGANGGNVNLAAISAEDFVKEAASGGMWEVRSSQFVADKNVSQETKQFAQRMIKDHSAANERLMALAKAQNIAVPETMMDKHQKMYDQLTGLTGKELETKYHQLQAQAHEESLLLFSRAEKSLQDGDLKQFASTTLPTLREHARDLTAHDH